MGKKRSNLRSSPKGCNSGNNIIVGNGSSSSGGGGAGSISNHGIHSGLGTQNTNSAGAASSSLAIPATSAASSRLQQQQQPMQSLFQGEYPNVMPSSTTASSTSTAAATAEKWAWLTEMAVAGAAAASSSGGNHTNGITFPGGGGVMMGNNTSGDCGLMTMTTGNSSSGSSNANSAKKMSHHPDAVSAEQYLQSFSQLLASEMGAAYEQSPSGSNSIKEVLSAALKAQQNNANLRISGSGSVVIRGTGSNSSCNDNKTGKKRSSSSSNTTTTTNTAISSNCSGPNNNKDVGKVMNFQQYLKVTADSYQRIYEQEQKARTQHATTNTTPSSSSPTTTTNAVGSGNGSSRTFPTKNTTKNKNASRKKRNQHHTVASAGAPTAPSTAKEKFAPSLAYPTDGTATTNTNFDPINNNYNNNNTPEDLRTLLPIFTELVSLTNKIVTAQENGNVNQVDATTQSCKKVLKDGQAMGVLGVAMKELNKHPPPLSVGIGGGDDYRLMEGQAYVEGGGVAGMNALLQSMTIHGKNFSIGTENFGTGGGGGGRSTAAMSKEELERRRTSIQAAQNEAIRKMAALGATMQTWQQQQQQHQPNGNASDLERVGEGTGTPVFSFTLGGGEPSATHPKTSTSSMIGPLPPPFLSSAGEVAVPPIPPPPGGWPPSTVQAAAPLGYDYSISPATVSTSTFPAFVDAAHLSGPCLPQIPMPMMSGSDTMNSEEWLEYFDAYLRNHGVKGGLDEFEEFARLSSQGAVITASMTAEGVIMENIAGDAAWHGQHPDPQDRWAPPGLRDKDDAGHLPASFEYDDSRYSSDTTDNVLSEQSRISLAIEEEEQRTKKAAKKRDKKARQKERAKREAEVKAALAAMKKREKVITSWRSRVVAACSAGDARKMDALVGESPFKHYVYDPKSLCFDEAEEEDDDDGNEKHDDMPKSQEEYLLKQMEWFLSNCLQKYPCPPSSSSTELTSTQAQPFAQNVAREKLANYILSVSFDIVLHQSPSSQNRNAIHLAAYMGDVDFIQWVIRSQSSRTGNDVSYLECMCLDGGWSPLHYATAGGAKKVVELLLQEGVCVTMRTDSSLTCFKSRHENGITARELAIALQSGAVKDKIRSESDVLEYRLENASAADKAAYLKVLQALETRLADVENCGYSPLLEKADERYQADREFLPAQKNDRIDRQISSATSTSQTSKKKKKQQQPRANTKTPPPDAIAISTNSTSYEPSIVGDEDLNEALLGMGFTDDQIKSAARALGGFERATADDMVVWILGESDNADSGSAPDTAIENHAVTQSKVQVQALPRANADQKIKASVAEEAARKRQEELAASKRAAEKREEQRRIRREWNEREQARQMQEKNAKIKEVMTRRQQVDNPKFVPEAILPMALGSDAVGGVPPPSVFGAAAGGIGKKHHHDAGPPLTIFAGGPKMSSAKSKNVASNMGIPQAPTVLRTPKILARPLHPPAPSDTAYSKPLSQGVVGNQLLFEPPSSSSSNAKPTGASPSRNIFVKSTHSSRSNHRNDQPTEILRKESSPGVTKQNINMTNSTHRILSHHSGHRAPTGFALKDPVSLVASSSMTSSATTPALRQGVAPPGFIQSSSIHNHMERSAKEEAAVVASSSSFVETSTLGMIRATAREFVPTYFKPLSASTSNTVPSMSAQFMSTRPPPPPTIPPTRTDSNDDSENLMFEHVSSLLSTFGAESTTPTVQSVTSSITGPSGVLTNNNSTKDENNAATSRVGSIMTFESSTAVPIGGPFVGGGGNGIQTRSIFESISSNQESNNLALGSGGGIIWGTGGSGRSNVNQNSSMGLAGLNFSSFMGGV